MAIYTEVLNTDAEPYGGSGVEQRRGAVTRRGIVPVSWPVVLAISKAAAARRGNIEAFCKVVAGRRPAPAESRGTRQVVDPRAARAGEPYPLGATPDGGGVNFALFSENAEAVELCLFSEGNSLAGEETRILVRENVRRGVALLRPRPPAPDNSTATASVVPTTPRTATASIPNKLLLDPYARETVGDARLELPEPRLQAPVEAQRPLLRR